MAIWIRLLQRQRIDKAGVPKDYHPGDWVKIGTQQAARWIAEGVATAPSTQSGELYDDSGVVIRGQNKDSIALLDGVGVPHRKESTVRFPWGKACYWEPSLSLRVNLLPVGFQLLERWDVAAAIYDYDILACHVGTDEDRARTEEVTRDLRILCYNPRLVFVKRGAVGRRLLETWEKEREDGGHDLLAFLRAIYLTPCLLCALPATWVNPSAQR